MIIHRTRPFFSHPDVDRIEEEVQQLNVRWENVGAQVAERLKAAERALQIQMVFRSEYENEMAWLDRVSAASLNLLDLIEDVTLPFNVYDELNHK